MLSEQIPITNILQLYVSSSDSIHSSSLTVPLHLNYTWPKFTIQHYSANFSKIFYYKNQYIIFLNSFPMKTKRRGLKWNTSVWSNSYLVTCLIMPSKKFTSTIQFKLLLLYFSNLIINYKSNAACQFRKTILTHTFEQIHF